MKTFEEFVNEAKETTLKAPYNILFDYIILDGKKTFFCKNRASDCHTPDDLNIDSVISKGKKVDLVNIYRHNDGSVSFKIVFVDENNNEYHSSLFYDSTKEAKADGWKI